MYGSDGNYIGLMTPYELYMVWNDNVKRYIIS
jgi:hypothetical protein